MDRNINKQRGIGIGEGFKKEFSPSRIPQKKRRRLVVFIIVRGKNHVNKKRKKQRLKR